MSLDLRSSRSATPIPLARLVAIELRKAVDTRAGMWLMIVIAVASLLPMAAMQAVSDPVDRSATDLFVVALLPILLLLPVVGILLVTTEFSARGALITFTLVPRRERVVTAKLLAAALLALGVGLIALAAAAALAAAGGAGWTHLGETVSLVAMSARAVLILGLTVTCGLAFGLLLRSSPLAIVSYFMLPQIATIAVAIWEPISGKSDWVVPTEAWTQLIDARPLSSGDWAEIAVTAGLWILLPLAGGLVRLWRSDIK